MSIPLSVRKWEWPPPNVRERLVDGLLPLTSWWSFWKIMQRV
jgi:hypothetical protein